MGKRIILIVGALLLSGPPAFAQPDFSKDNLTRLMRKVGVHANVGVRNPTDHDVTKGLVEGVSIGLAPGRTNGWKFPVGLSWYSEDLNGATGDQFGTLNMRAVLAGVGYGWHFGKFSTSVALQGGYAMNRVRTVAGAAQGFASGEPIQIEVDNSFILRPRWHTEYFVARKLSFRTSLNYIRANPDLVVTTAAGREPGTWRAHAVNASIGVGYYPFLR